MLATYFSVAGWLGLTSNLDISPEILENDTVVVEEQVRELTPKHEQDQEIHRQFFDHNIETNYSRDDSHIYISMARS